MLEDDIYALLSTDASIQAVLNAANNVYVGYIPKGSPVSPSIVIQITHTQRLKGADGTNGLQMKRVQTDSRHVKAGVARQISSAVLNLLKDLSGNLATTSVQGVIPGKDMDMGLEPSDGGEVFRRLNDFDVWHVDGAGVVPYTPIAPTVLGANAGYIEGVPIAATPPADGQGLVYDAVAKTWKPGTVSGSGANFAGPETPTGAIDGVNAAFTLAHTPLGLQLFRNLGLAVEGIAFSRVTNVVTFNAGYIPQPGDSLVAFYRF